MRLLTFIEWLNEKEGNIPFEALDDMTKIKLRTQYEYDKKERLSKQAELTQSDTLKAVGKWLRERASRVAQLRPGDVSAPIDDESVRMDLVKITLSPSEWESLLRGEWEAIRSTKGVNGGQ